MDEVKVQNDNRPPFVKDYELYLADRRKTTSAIIGAVTVLGILAIIGATIVLLVLANRGVFDG